MKKLWLMMAFPLVLAFTACSEEKDPEPDPTPGTEEPVTPRPDDPEKPEDPEKPDEPQDPDYDIITFESCVFPAGQKNNVIKGNEFFYEELGVRFAGVEKYSMYCGALVSGEARIAEDGNGTPLPYCVALPKDTEHPGANGSDKFGILLNIDAIEDNEPEFGFEVGVEREIVSLDVMNSMDMHQYMAHGFYSKDSLVDGQWVKATFTGYGAQGDETGSVDVYLGDFRNGKTFIMEEWTSVDVSALGKVNKVRADMSWSEAWDKPITPTNFTICIDNIKFVKEEK
ncbi:MAG: DUF4465 domain-containing protein [Bacteroides sp.]|nr:DUF4465 domain-containing protein [Bacteroides sp.]